MDIYNVIIVLMGIIGLISLITPFVLAILKANENYKYLVSIKKLPDGIIKRSIFYSLAFPYFDRYPKLEDTDVSVKLAENVIKYLNYIKYSVIWLIAYVGIGLIYSYLS